MSNHHYHNLIKGDQRSRSQHQSDTELEVQQHKRTDSLLLCKMPPYQSSVHHHDTIDIDTIDLDIDTQNDDRPHVVLMCNPQEDTTEEQPPEDRFTKELAHHNHNQAHHTHQAAATKHPHPVAASNHQHHDQQLYNHRSTNIPEAMFKYEEPQTASTEMGSYTGASSGSELDDSTIDSTSTFNEHEPQVDRTTVLAATGLGFDDEEDDDDEEEASSVEVDGEDRESTNDTPVVREGEGISFPKLQRKTSIGGVSVQEEEEANGTQPAPPRRVTFAGQVVRCPEDSRRILEVLDAVTVMEIPHVSEYSNKQKRSLWYTREEMTQMKALCIDTVRRAISKHQYNHSIGVSAEQETLYCRFFFLRGLERFVDYYNVVNNESSTKDTTSSSTDREGGQGGQASS